MTQSLNLAPQMTPRKVGVIVLGMHRSGTSALSGLLTMLGCNEPATLMPPHPDNPKGFFESQILYLLNAKMLASAGLTWMDWRPLQPSWFDTPKADGFVNQAKECMLAEFPGSRLFALKDPRLCRLLPLYVNVLEQLFVQPVVAHTHRNPLNVAASLQARDGIDPEIGQLIWLRHVPDAERNSRGLVRSFVSYDQLLSNWRGVADRLSHDLNVNWPRLSSTVAAEIDTFLTPTLRHHELAKERMLENPQSPEWIRETYEILERWAEHGETASDQAKLDSINAAFSGSASTFFRLVQAIGTSAKKARADQAAKVAELESRLAGSERDNRAAEAKAEAAEAQSQALSEELTHLRITMLQHHHEAQKLADRARSAEAEIAQVRAHKTAEFDDLRKTADDLKRKTVQLGAFLEGTKAAELALRRDLRLQQTRFEEQSQHIATLEYVRDALLNSTSWKITGPVRRLFNLLRRSS